MLRKILLCTIMIFSLTMGWGIIEYSSAQIDTIQNYKMSLEMAENLPPRILGAVQSNPHLYVSAEGQNSLNEVSPVNIIEIAVIDPLISATDEGKGEPNVEVNGAEIRMAQATDGAWYAYIADADGARHLDATAAGGGVKGNATDVGAFCSADSGSLERTPPFFSESRGVAFARQHDGVISGVNGTATDTQTLPVCDGPSVPTGPLLNNVVREAEELNCNVGTDNCGQIGIFVNQTFLWPFVQLYDFEEEGSIDIVYNRPGGDETVELLIDDPSEGISFDRFLVPQGAQIFFTVSDLTLNVDPTDEDHWVAEADATASATDRKLHYQLFDENGDTSGDGSGAELIDYYGVAVPGFDDAFDEVFQIVRNGPDPTGTPQINCQPNDDFDGSTTVVTVTPTGECMTSGGVPSTFFPVALVEDESNSSDFINWDENNKANLVVRDEALRGISFEVEYESPGFVSVVVLHFDGTLSIDSPPEGWGSGQRIGFELDDEDQNKNTLIAEDFDLFDPTKDLIPTLRIGDPFTLGEDSITDGPPTFTFFNGSHNTGIAPSKTVAGGLHINGTGGAGNGTVTTDTEIQAFSDRAIIDPLIDSILFSLSANNGTAGGLLIDYDATTQDLLDSINDPTGDFEGRNLFNYDLTSLEDAGFIIDDVYLIRDDPGTDFIDEDFFAILLEDDVGDQGLDNLVDTTELFPFLNADPTDELGQIITFAVGNNTVIDTTMTRFSEFPIIKDFCSIGVTGDRGLAPEDRVNNCIYRIEAEETSRDTGIFEGSLEFIMLNQLNIFDSQTYNDLRTIDDNILFLVHDTLTGDDAPQVKYLDKPSTGVDSEINIQEDAPTHSGNVTFDKTIYEIGDVVLITTIDEDLNEDNDTIDIFTIVNPNILPPDPAVETIGEEDLGTYSDGSPFGRLLDIRFDNELWATSILDLTAPPGQDCITPGMPNDGFFSTGTTLRETTATSGVFISDFQMPSTYCSRDSGGDTISVAGTTIKVNLVDFRDVSGLVTEVSDMATIPSDLSVDAYLSMGLGNTIPFSDEVTVSDTPPENGSIATADFGTGLLTQKSDSLTDASLGGIAFKDNGDLFATNATHLFEVNATTGDLLSETLMIKFSDGSPFPETVIDLTADPAGTNQLDILSFNGTQFTFNILREDGSVRETGLTSRCNAQVGSIAWLTPDSILFTFIRSTVPCSTPVGSSFSGLPDDVISPEDDPIITLVEREVIRGSPPSLGFINTWTIDKFYDGLAVDSDGEIFATYDDGVYELECIDGSPGSCSSTLVAGNGTNPDDIDFLP